MRGACYSLRALLRASQSSLESTLTSFGNRLTWKLTLKSLTLKLKIKGKAFQKYKTR